MARDLYYYRANGTRARVEQIFMYDGVGVRHRVMGGFMYAQGEQLYQFFPGFKETPVGMSTQVDNALACRVGNAHLLSGPNTLSALALSSGELLGECIPAGGFYPPWGVRFTPGTNPPSGRISIGWKSPIPHPADIFFLLFVGQPKLYRTGHSGPTGDGTHIYTFAATEAWSLMPAEGQVLTFGLY